MLNLDLVLNLSLLVALSIVSSFIEKFWAGKSRRRRLFQGALFGAVAIFGMLKPISLAPGVIIDGRSIMVSLCGLFFGPWAAAVSGTMAIVFRLWLGGGGAFTGVLVTLASAGIGVLGHYRYNPETETPSAVRLFLFGVVVHVVMLLLLLFTLPEGNGTVVVRRFGLAILVLFPLATILSGKILADQIVVRRTLLALQASGKRLAAAQLMAKTGDFTWDVQTGEVIWSDALFTLLQYDKSEDIDYDKVNREIHHPDDLARVTEWLQQCTSSGSKELTPNEYRLIRKDGQTLWVHAAGVIEYSPAGSPRVFATVQDITERKHAEDVLRQYEHIVSSTSDMLALIDPGYVHLAANEAYVEALALTQEGLIGRSLAEIFGEEFFGRVIEPQARLCLAGEDVRSTEWFELPDSGRRCIEAVYSPYRGPGGEVLGFVATCRDITEQEQLQAQLLQAQKMDSVGRLAGGVAHDYNNVSSIIIGYAELALDKVDIDDPLRGDLLAILKAANRSTDITRQLLAFARRQTIAPKVLDLNEAVLGTLKMLRQLIGEDIDLAWLPGAELWPVKVDPTQVDQILINLCLNARDAIVDGGKVTIETGRASFDENYCVDHPGFTEGDYVLLAVSDDGRGIAPELLDKVFEPFFTTKEVGAGTGLGLASVYGIAKQNGGFVSVYSEPGEGTSVKIYLPRCRSGSVGKLPEEATGIPRGQGELVLLVEDNAAILVLGRRMLESLDYRVLSAATPGQARELAAEHADRIDLLMTDVVMPGTNGRELSEQLLPVCPRLKVLFMSGYTANVIAHRGVLEAGVGFIPKPFSRRELALKIRDVLDNADTPGDPV